MNTENLPDPGTSTLNSKHVTAAGNGMASGETSFFAVRFCFSSSESLSAPDVAASCLRSVTFSAVWVRSVRVPFEVWELTALFLKSDTLTPEWDSAGWTESGNGWANRVPAGKRAWPGMCKLLWETINEMLSRPDPSVNCLVGLCAPSLLIA